MNSNPIEAQRDQRDRAGRRSAKRADDQQRGAATTEERGRIAEAQPLEAAAKARMKPGAFHRESSDQLPASAGVIVNETNSEVRVAIDDDQAELARKLPDLPGQKRDRQEHDDVDERDDDRRQADLRCGR